MFVCCLSQWKDIINKTDSYAVLGKCPKECAAQLRISEKNFVADHARSLNSELGAGHACLPDGFVEVWDKPTRCGEWLPFVNLSSRSAPPAAAAVSTPCPCSGQQQWRLQSEWIFVRDNGGHRYGWVRQCNQSCWSSWGFVFGGIVFQRGKPINPQIAQLHIYRWPQPGEHALTCVQARLKYDMVLTGTSKVLREAAVVRGSVAWGRKILGACGGVADLSDVVLRNNEMRGGFFLRYNLGVDCSCAFVQIQTAGAALITSNLFKSVIWFFKPLAFRFCFMWKPLAGLEAGCALDGS